MFREHAAACICERSQQYKSIRTIHATINANAMKQLLLNPESRSDEFPSPAAPQFQKRARSIATFCDSAFDFANTFKDFIGAN